MNYDKNKLIGNIYAIAKKKDINIKDLETKAKVSVGYFSRMLKDKENLKASPTVSMMLSVSEDLGVSIDLLATCDFEKEELPSIRIISFLDKAIQKTITGELKWVSELSDDDEKGVEQVGPAEKKPKSKNPLFVYEVLSYEGETKLRRRFRSKFTPEWCHPEGLMYYFEMNGNRYYLLNITSRGENDFESYHYEMYVVKENTAVPLCSSVIGNKSIVSQKLDELYSVIRKVSAENPSNDEIFDEIDAFLKAMLDKESK